MTADEQKAHHRRYYEEVWNQGNLNVVDELFAPNYLGMSQNIIRGSGELKKYISTFRAGIPDLHFTVEDQIVEGDKVLTRWTVSGTHKGTLLGIAPTGKQGTVKGMSLVQFVNGKIQQDWISWDELGMWQQLGVVAAPGGQGQSSP